MLYKYKDAYYILRSRRLSEVQPILTENDGLTFSHTGKKIQVSDINIIDCVEVSTEDIKKELKKPIKTVEKVIDDKPIKPIKINKTNKNI